MQFLVPAVHFALQAFFVLLSPRQASPDSLNDAAAAITLASDLKIFLKMYINFA